MNGYEQHGEQQPFGEVQRQRAESARRMRQQPPAYESVPLYGSMLPSWREGPEQKLFRQLRDMLGGLVGSPGGRLGRTIREAPWGGAPQRPHATWRDLENAGQLYGDKPRTGPRTIPGTWHPTPEEMKRAEREVYGPLGGGAFGKLIRMLLGIPEPGSPPSGVEKPL